MFPAEDFASRLRFVLGDASLRRVAWEVGVSHTGVRRWMQGQALPDGAHLRALCVAFNLSANYLLGLTEDPRPRVVTASSSYGAELVIRVRNDQLEEVTVRNVRRRKEGEGA